jgi:fumarate hydratase class II
MANAVSAFAEGCVLGIEADEARCQELLDRNLSLVTGLAPVIGYDRAAAISKEAYRTGRTIREVALDWKVLPIEELDNALDPRRMTEPGLP